MLENHLMEVAGIVAVGIIVWLLVRWKNRPAQLAVWIMKVGLAVAVAVVLLYKQLPPDIIGWIYLLGAIAFAVAFSINVTLEQTAKVMTRRSGRELFNRRHAVGAMAASSFFILMGILRPSWPALVGGGGMVLGIGIILLWETQNRPKPTPPPATGLEIQSPKR